jgi:hypothetical protein
LARDSDSSPLGLRTVTITPAPTSVIDEHKARMSKDPRFAQWALAEPERPHVLLWSRRQNGLHIEPVDRMLTANRAAYREDRPTDYVVLFIGPIEQCEVTADNLRGTLADRAITRARLEPTP